MHWNIVLGTVASVIGISGFFWAALRWAHRKTVSAIADDVAKKIQPVYDELKHNGGSSMKDMLKETHDELLEHKKTTAGNFRSVHRRIDTIDERIDDFVDKRPKRRS